LVRKIEDALERREFALHYQPKVDCAGRVVGLEALIRWNHPVLGLRMPGEFLPLDRKRGRDRQHRRLGHRRSPAPAGQLAGAAGHELTISVNIAARQLVRRQFAERLEAVLSAGGRDRLEIEILESARSRTSARSAA
jgi:EAL domain-containing protein (putative c-di-GMP-specific phosphodiesterase class I)